MARRTGRQLAASRKNIRKAQIASAKKRKGRKTKIAVGVLGAAVAGGALAYGLRSRKPKYSKALVHVPGKGHSGVEYRKTVIPPGWGKSDLPPLRGIKRTSAHVFKTNQKGITTSTTKNRMIYDTNRRRKYWQGKPVGGAPRKKYTSDIRGRR